MSAAEKKGDRRIVAAQERLKEMVGQKYGQLTVLKLSKTRTYPSGQTHPFVLARCECGNQDEHNAYSLRQGKTLRCLSCVAQEAKARLLKNNPKKKTFKKPIPTAAHQLKEELSMAMPSKDITREFYYQYFREDPSASIDDAARDGAAEKDVIVRKELISAIRADVRRSIGLSVPGRPPTDNPGALRASILESARTNGSMVANGAMTTVSVKPKLVPPPTSVQQPQPAPTPAPEAPREPASLAASATKAPDPQPTPPPTTSKPTVEDAVRFFMERLRETGLEFQTFDVSLRDGEAEFVFEIRQQRSGKVKL